MIVRKRVLVLGSFVVIVGAGLAATPEPASATCFATWIDCVEALSMGNPCGPDKIAYCDTGSPCEGGTPWRMRCSAET
jgi:hypothetical protein